MKRLFWLLGVAFVFAQEPSSCPRMLEYAEESLPLSGTLEAKSGFVYVDLDDDYVDKLLPFIHKEGFKKPPYFGRPELVGAHITVIYPGEMAKHGITSIRESGERIGFSLKRCQIVHPPNWKEVDELYLVTINSPRLDAIRAKYGLLPKRHDFHITIGVKPAILKGTPPAACGWLPIRCPNFR